MEFKEIKNIWKNSFETESLNEAQIREKVKINSKSNIILNKILNNYKYGIIALLFIYIVGIILLFVFVKTNIALLLFVVASFFTVLALLTAYKSINKIKKTIHSDDNVITTLNKTISIMEKSLRFGMGNLYKFLIIPMALILGMTIGIFISSGDNGFISTIQSLETSSIIKMIAVLIGGSIISIMLSQFMMKRMYKNNLEELKKCLNAFEEIN